MAYTKDIVNANDVPNQSQPLLLGNFQAIFDTIAIDHVALNASGEGKHKQVMMPEQTVVPTTGADEAVFFSQVGAYSGVTEIAFKREGDPATVTEFTTGKNAASGWLLLPSGILVKWGVVQWNVGNPQTNTFVITSGGTDGPTIGTLYNMNLTTYDGASTNYDQYITLGSFVTGTQTVTYHASKRSTTAADTVNAIKFYYFALGLPA